MTQKIDLLTSYIKLILNNNAAGNAVCEWLGHVLAEVRRVPSSTKEERVNEKSLLRFFWRNI